MPSVAGSLSRMSSEAARYMLRNFVSQGSSRASSSPQKLKMFWGPQGLRRKETTLIKSLEVNMGTVEQTPHRGSHRTSRREKEGQGMGVAWETGIKDTYPAQGHIEEHRRNTAVPRQQGHRAGGDSPTQRNRTSQRRVLPQTSSVSRHGGLFGQKKCN